MAFADEGFETTGHGFTARGYNDKIGGSPADVINRMADVLDEAASAVSTQAQPYTGEMEDRTDAGSRARIDAQRGSELPGTRRESMPQNLGPADAPAIPDLGPNPSLAQLEEVLGGSEFSDATMGPEGGPGGPADAPAVPANLMGGEETAADVSAGQEAATFLSDYRSGMGVRPDRQDSLMTQLDALQAEAAQLRQMATTGSPSMSGVDYGGALSALNTPGGFATTTPYGSTEQAVATPIQPTAYPSMAGVNYGGAMSALNTPGGFATTTPYASPEQALATPINPEQEFVPSNEDIQTLRRSSYPSMAGVNYGGALSALGTPGGFSTRTPYVDKVKTHEDWYPNHQKYAALAGAGGLMNVLSGKNRAWKETLKDDMRKRGIIGEKDTKYFSEDWIEYSGLFDANGVALDGSGDVMPGTDRVQEVGFLDKIFNPYTKSGVVDPNQQVETGASTLGAVNERDAFPVTGSGDAEVDAGGVTEPKSGTVAWMRAEYPWAANLADSVLKNAIKYPDYLRLIQEAVANNQDIPLVVPDWIISGGINPNHPALQSRSAVF